MSGSLTLSATVSRPKIHRPPALLETRRFFPAEKLRPVFHRPVVLPFAVVLTILFAVMAIQKQVAGLSGVSHAAPFLPPVIVDAKASVLPPEKSPTTLVFASQAGTIVGQFVKVPEDPEQVTEIRPISNIDKKAGRELLSIISRIN